ncbi:MAG: hypothetical protein WC716_04285 [Chitinophagaceae bacterium]|jgi:hypothetical protein
MENNEDKNLINSLRNATSEQLANADESLNGRQTESITPELVHSWQHSIESLGDSMIKIAEIYFEHKTEEGQRAERNDSRKMDFSFRAFKMRYWAALSVLLASISVIVFLEVIEKGQSLVPFLVGVITIAGNFLFKESGLFNSKPTIKDNNKPED